MNYISEHDTQKQVVMPFGKWKGKPVDAIPIKYIKWLHKEVDLFGELETAIYKRLGLPVPIHETRDDRIERCIKSFQESMEGMESDADTA